MNCGTPHKLTAKIVQSEWKCNTREAKYGVCRIYQPFANKCSPALNACML